MPGAEFIGFSGRSIEHGYLRRLRSDFCPFEDAKGDKATVPSYHESRLAKLDVNREEIDRLNKDVAEVIEDEEDVSARESTKGKLAELAKLVGVEEIARIWWSTTRRG